jgi:PAS domain-containing protein
VRQISISLIENFALLLVLAYVIGKLPLHIIGSRKIAVQLLIGVLFGIVAVIAMMIPIKIYDGVVLDSRVIFIALAGPFGGYLAPVIAGLIAGFFHVYNGGNGTLAEVIAICLPILLGIILVKFPLKDDRRLRFSKLALCGIVMGVLISPTALLLPDAKMGLKLLQTSILIMPFILMVLFPITDMILNAQTWHLKVTDELQQNEDALKDAQKIGRFGNWEYDLISKNITWSDELFRLMERDPSLGPMTINEIEAWFPTETRDRFITNVAQALKSGNTVEGDYSLNLPSRRLVHHYVIIRPVKNIDGEFIKLICTVQDITDRKNAEENLRLTEEQRRALFKSIPVPINCWRQVGDDFELFEYNESSLIMTGGKIAEYLGVKHSVFSPARPDLLSDLKRCITRQETFTKENLNTTFSTGKKVIKFLLSPFARQILP